VKPPPTSKWRARWRLMLIALLLAAHLPLHGLWRLFGRRSPWPTGFLRRAGHAAGVDARIEGLAIRRNVLIVANHLTWLDILILAGVTGARFVAKDDIARWPLFGFLAGLNRTIYVSQGRRAEVLAQADVIRAALVEPQPVALFPEGGTGEGDVLLPFRPSLLSALLPPLPDVAVQPVAIDYGADVPRLIWYDTSMGVEMMRVMGLRGRRTAIIRFLEPIPTANCRDRKMLAKQAQAAIASALGWPS
jgi:1-acyl-sn-glycerol-3-phosphate acyltransferase